MAALQVAVKTIKKNKKNKTSEKTPTDAHKLFCWSEVLLNTTLAYYEQWFHFNILPNPPYKPLFCVDAIKAGIIQHESLSPPPTHTARGQQSCFLRYRHTYPNIKHRANWLVITDLQSHMAAIAQLRNVLPLPEYPIAPCRNTTLLTRTEVKITVSRHSSDRVTLRGRILFSQGLGVFLTRSISAFFFHFIVTTFSDNISQCHHVWSNHCTLCPSHRSQHHICMLVGKKSLPL